MGREKREKGGGNGSKWRRRRGNKVRENYSKGEKLIWNVEKRIRSE